jgi:hypothetical protein
MSVRLGIYINRDSRILCARAAAADESDKRGDKTEG